MHVLSEKKVQDKTKKIQKEPKKTTKRGKNAHNKDEK